MAVTPGQIVLRQTAAMSSPTILVVYHDETYLRRVRDALAPAGYLVRSAESTAAAIEELKRSHPRVVVLCPCVSADLRQEITRSVHKINPQLAVLHLDSNHVDDISGWPIQ